MSVATPKSQATEPPQLDVVLACRKREAHRPRKSQAETAFQGALEHAQAKVRRRMATSDLGLRSSDFRRLALPVNDRRVVVISQFLVAACAGWSAEDLADVLSSTLTNLDLTAMRLPEARSGEIRKQASQTEEQLKLQRDVRSRNRFRRTAFAQPHKLSFSFTSRLVTL